jgi:GH43 family beta-xylosidase
MRKTFFSSPSPSPLVRMAIQFNILFFIFLILGGCKKDDPAPESSATPTTGIVVNITPNTASIDVNLSIAGTFTIDSKGVCWSLTQNPTTGGSKTNEGPGPGKFTSQLTGLVPNTTYHIRSYVIGSGKTTYGNEVSFKTLESLTVTLTTSAVTSITVSSATSGGSMVTTGVGSISAKGICWSKSQNPTTSDFKTNAGTGVNSFTGSMASLEGGTTYYVRAYATDNNNATTYGNQVSFATPQPFTVTVQTSAVTAIAGATATAGGTITTTGTGSISTRGVCWSISTNPTIANAKTENGSGAGSFTSNLTGLTANTKYYVRSYATTSLSTVYGNEVSFTTTITAINLNLNGNWLTTAGTGITISGSSGTFYSFSTNWQIAANGGHVTLNSLKIRNISSVSTTTWNCQDLWLTTTNGNIDGTKWSADGTITMNADGKSITVTSTGPVSGSMGSTIYTRVN